MWSRSFLLICALFCLKVSVCFCWGFSIPKLFTDEELSKFDESKNNNGTVVETQEEEAAFSEEEGHNGLEDVTDGQLQDQFPDIETQADEQHRVVYIPKTISLDPEHGSTKSTMRRLNATRSKTATVIIPTRLITPPGYVESMSSNTSTSILENKGSQPEDAGEEDKPQAPVMDGFLIPTRVSFPIPVMGDGRGGQTENITILMYTNATKVQAPPSDNNRYAIGSEEVGTTIGSNGGRSRYGKPIAANHREGEPQRNANPMGSEVGDILDNNIVHYRRDLSDLSAHRTTVLVPRTISMITDAVIRAKERQEKSKKADTQTSVVNNTEPSNHTTDYAPRAPITPQYEETQIPSQPEEKKDDEEDGGMNALQYVASFDADFLDADPQSEDVPTPEHSQWKAEGKRQDEDKKKYKLQAFLVEQIGTNRTVDINVIQLVDKVMTEFSRYWDDEEGERPPRAV